ncbi:hypothetical protein [Bacillus litorisediminis]|uniref:hypothetical protein n=1 Tax=Bacillus litorisediminis TaxID=2922713 RepID=UPI001FB01049|nr:hypothetical protein [Bacillus litorisediminis]
MSGMYKNLKDIAVTLQNDETLLRLLYYPPKDLSQNTPDPLDPSLPNILEMDISKLWEIRDKHILFVPKTDDLTGNKLCRVYLYAGRRIPSRNYLIADQEVIIDTLCHTSYESVDLRSMRISDRINELLVSERITGIGRIDYVDGRQINAPLDYVGFQNVYEFGSNKK